MEDLTSEQLFEILKDAVKDRDTGSKRKNVYTVKKFINVYGITAGTDRVPAFLIYYTYKRKWLEEYDRNKVSKDTFFKEFKKEFKQVRTGRGRFYLLNKTSFDTSREGLLEAKNYDEKYRERQKKKRQRKIPQSKKES